MSVQHGQLLWEPSRERIEASTLHRFRQWLATTRDLRFDDYETLWQWSVDELDAFWASVWEFFDVIAHDPYETPLVAATMPGTQWFRGATLNYAENALRRRDDHLAVLYRSERGDEVRLTYAELYREVARAAAGLRQLGVRRGDRVAAFVSNCPEALVAFLATASLGATWSSCSPDFGTVSVLDRFRQIEPRVLIAVDGYYYNGRPFDRRAEVAEIRAGLPTVEATVLVSRLGDGLPGDVLAWDDFLGDAGELVFEPVPFSHPLWVLYSSGTTGLPKPIVHGQGGILLEHYKALGLHCDLGPDDRFFWFTTTGWMMWNFLIAGLLVGATVLLYDGSPAWPDLDALWKFAEQTGMTYFGTSAPYLMSCRKQQLRPAEHHDLSRLHSVGSTGAPLPPEGFAWVYEHVGSDVLLGSVSGGTDMCTAFVGSSPLLPVRAGEIQCRWLGMKVESWSPAGEPLVGEVGELVITQPAPSMPVFFWNDTDGSRLHHAYFDFYPGVWRHGDWITVTERGSCVIHGRSDATLNRGGVRMGTSDFYRVVESLPEVADALVVDTGGVEGEGELWLFVVPRGGRGVDEALQADLRAHLRRELSPRHVPDHIVEIPAVPRTLNGKKLEVPIKKILRGTPLEEALTEDALANPEALAPFVALAAGR